VSDLAWRYLGPGGVSRGSSDRFASREEAEAWLAGSWSALLERGIREVALVEAGGGPELYRMRLDEQGD
jgi:hypothetical protein